MNCCLEMELSLTDFSSKKQTNSPQAGNKILLWSMHLSWKLFENMLTSGLLTSTLREAPMFIESEPPLAVFRQRSDYNPSAKKWRRCGLSPTIYLYIQTVEAELGESGVLRKLAIQNPRNCWYSNIPGQYKTAFCSLACADRLAKLVVTFVMIAVILLLATGTCALAQLTTQELENEDAQGMAVGHFPDRQVTASC